MLKLLMLFPLIIALSSCGQKGGLYLPEETEAEAKTSDSSVDPHNDMSVDTNTDPSIDVQGV
jgi:predicted small lipoprotein YifL